MKRPKPVFLFTFLVVAIALAAMIATSSHATDATHSRKLRVVAGENFWGSLTTQLGGSHVSVTSVVSDPNADPHEYETNTATARTFATADYVVLNGAGYDSWGQKLLDASHENDRKVLTVADLLGKKNGDNPHFWYNPSYVNQVITQMDADLITLDPSDTAYFKQQLKTVQASLSTYQNRIATIKQQFAGTKVAATEDIFVYLANTAGLNLISPSAFIQAVAEGNDPPTNSVAQFQQQLEGHQPKLLVYNKQTVTPLTENVKKLAVSQNIPVVGITETIEPANASFQDWMNSEITAIQQALDATKNN